MQRFATTLRRIASVAFLWLMSLTAGMCVIALAAFLEWLIYDDWMHNRGPLQLFGTLLLGVLTTFVVLRWQITMRRRRLEMLRHFETIQWMNDRIRNALQGIDLIAFAHSESAEQVRSAVDAISLVLHQVLHETHPENRIQQEKQGSGRNAIEVQR